MMKMKITLVIALFWGFWNIHPCAAQHTSRNDSIVSGWIDSATDMTSEMFFDTILPKVENYLNSSIGNDAISADIRRRAWAVINHLKSNRQYITDESLKLLMPSISMGLNVDGLQSFLNDSTKMKMPDMNDVNNFIRRSADRFIDIVKDMKNER